MWSWRNRDFLGPLLSRVCHALADFIDDCGQGRDNDLCKTTTISPLKASRNITELRTMAELQTTISPHTQKPYVQRTYPTTEKLEADIKASAEAQKEWAKKSLKERIAIGWKFIVCLLDHDPLKSATNLRTRRTSLNNSQMSCQWSLRCKWAGACHF